MVMKFVVLSGGMDSGVTMAKASREAGVSCASIMESLRVIELPWLKELGGGLTTEAPKISEETLEKVAEETAKAVW